MSQGSISRNYSNLLIKLLLSSFCIGGVIFLQLSQLKPQDSTLSSEDFIRREQIKRTRLEFLKKAPSFGFDNLVASWTFLDFVQYYGDAEARKATGYYLSPDYFEVVAEEDPRFVDAFLYLDSATSLFAGKPQVSVNALSESLKYLSPEIPRAYQVWNYKGIDELLFLGDVQSAKASFEKTAEWAEFQDTEKSRNIAARAKETVAFLESNPDSHNAQIASWLMILGNARDQQTRQLALSQIESLGGEVVVTSGRLTVRLPEEDK